MSITYLGIDIAKDKFDVALLLENNFKTKVFSNTNKGFNALLNWIKQYSVKELHICMEATGIYSEELAHFLYNQNFNVSIVNPARIKGFSQSELGRNKTDKADAKLIARFCKALKPV